MPGVIVRTTERFNHSLGLFGVLHLVAEGDRAPGPDAAGHIGVHGANRHPRHWNAVILVDRIAGGHRDAQQFPRLKGILEKHLIEIAHPEEEQGIAALGLGFEILAEHRRELAFGDIAELFPILRHGAAL